MAHIARSQPTNASTNPLGSPYEASPKDLILPGEDFTVRITTISKSILDDYGEYMQRGGRWHNDHFVLMSHFGIGSNQGEMPSTAINYVEACDRIDNNILSFWGENIRWIEDYRDVGSNGNAGRVYIGTSAFCQNLGSSPLQSIRRTFTEVTSLVGRFAPALAPYASAATTVLRGVVNLADKLRRHPGEVKTSQLSLYPATQGSLPPGDAYLQRGSYVFFFEDVDTSELFLTPSGEVVARQGFHGRIPPYVVINIVPDLVDAPASEMLDRSVALDLLEKYDSRFGLPRHGEQEDAGSGSSLKEGLQTIGKAYRLQSKLQRLTDLRHRRSLLPSETVRIQRLVQELQKAFPTLTL